MKISETANYDYLFKWHRWFAWYPVRTDKGELVWLETVERRLPEWSRYDDCASSSRKHRRIEK